MAAGTRVGMGPVSSNLTLQTAQDLPSAAPLNLTGVNASSTSILLTWMPPPVLERNGVIVSYTVVGRAAGSNDSFARVITVSDMTALITSLDGTNLLSKCVLKHHPLPPPPLVSSHTRSFLFHSLLHHRYTWYEFRVLASTIVGDGVLSEAITVRTGEDAPVGPPRNVVASSPLTGAILVSWEPPAAELQLGVILGYRVYYAVEGETQQQLDVGAVNQRLLAGLDHNSWYIVSVAAYTR